MHQSSYNEMIAAIARIMASNLKEIIATDTIPLRGEAMSCERIRILTIAGLLSEAIRRIYYNESVSSLFI